LCSVLPFRPVHDTWAPQKSQLIPCCNPEKMNPCIPHCRRLCISRRHPRLCIPRRHRPPLSAPSPPAAAPGVVLSDCSSRRYPLHRQINASPAPWGPAPPAHAIVRPVVRRGQRTRSLPTQPSSGPPSSGLTHQIDKRLVHSRQACLGRGLPKSSYGSGAASRARSDRRRPRPPPSLDLVRPERSGAVRCPKSTRRP
jgi:hypothetical protein